MAGIMLAALPPGYAMPAALPGVPLEEVREPVFALADVTVRAWVAGRRAAGRRVIIADDSWAPHVDGDRLTGQDLLSFPAGDRDMAVIDQVRSRRAAEFIARLGGGGPS